MVSKMNVSLTVKVEDKRDVELLKQALETAFNTRIWADDIREDRYVEGRFITFFHFVISATDENRTYNSLDRNGKPK